MRRVISVCLLLVASCPLAPALAWAADGAGASPPTAAAGSFGCVELIQNGPEPRHGQQVLRPRELWRRGSEDDDLLFGFVIAALGDESGRVYLLDRWLANVVALSAEGELIGRLSREGEGPGETRQPTCLTWLPAGELGIVQPMPGRLVRIGLDGDPAGSLVPAGVSARAAQFGILTEASWRGGTLACGGSRVHLRESGKRQEFFLSICDPATGAERAGILEKETLDDGRSARDEFYWVHEGRWCLGPDGRVYAAPERDVYSVHVHGADGELERLIEREGTPRRRTAEEKAALAARLEPGPDEPGTDREIRLADREPCIAELRVADDGELWVRPGPEAEETRPGIFQVWDVFSPDGDYVRRVALELPGDAVRDRLFFLPRDRLLVVRGYREASQAMWGAGPAGDQARADSHEVICYEAAPAAAGRNP